MGEAWEKEEVEKRRGFIREKPFGGNLFTFLGED
jgi:hypothetical protein